MKKTVLIQHATGEIHVGTSTQVRALYAMAQTIIIARALINPNIIIRKTLQP